VGEAAQLPDELDGGLALLRRPRSSVALGNADEEGIPRWLEFVLSKGVRPGFWLAWFRVCSESF
jgi:hypothetical protein